MHHSVKFGRQHTQDHKNNSSSTGDGSGGKYFDKFKNHSNKYYFPKYYSTNGHWKVQCYNMKKSSAIHLNAISPKNAMSQPLFFDIEY